MDFRIGTGGISYPNVSQVKQNKKVEKQSFQGSLEQVIQNQKITEPQDSIEFSEESDYKKLEKIKELNDNTDFSGMTKLEKFVTIQERYKNVFPDFEARMNVGAGIKVNADMQKQYYEQLKKVDITNFETGDLYRAYKGYDKMTDEQKWESIQNEYGNPKNGIEQICALSEMLHAGLIDLDTLDHMFFIVQQNARYAGSKSNGRDYVKDKLFLTSTAEQFAYEYLQNNKIDFNDIATETKQFVRYDDPQTQREFNYEVDYITDLMNALEERED